MSELNTHMPDRPEGWSVAQEGYERVTRIDAFGAPYEVWQEIDKRPNLAALWAKWRTMQVEHTGEGRLTMDPERQNRLIEIENMGI